MSLYDKLFANAENWIGFRKGLREVCDRIEALENTDHLGGPIVIGDGERVVRRGRPPKVRTDA